MKETLETYLTVTSLLLVGALIGALSVAFAPGKPPPAPPWAPPPGTRRDHKAVPAAEPAPPAAPEAPRDEIIFTDDPARVIIRHPWR